MHCAFDALSQRYVNYAIIPTKDKPCSYHLRYVLNCSLATPASKRNKKERHLRASLLWTLIDPLLHCNLPDRLDACFFALR